MLRLGFRFTDGQLVAHVPSVSLAEAHNVQLLGCEPTHLAHNGSQAACRDNQNKQYKSKTQMYKELTMKIF